MSAWDAVAGPAKEAVAEFLGAVKKEKSTGPIEIVRKHDGFTVGWACRKCGLFWSSKQWPGEQYTRAETCCESKPCPGCGGNLPKHYLKCISCQSAERFAKFKAKPESPWNGEFPIVVYDDDIYFWSLDEINDWIGELEEDSQFEFEACDENEPRSFNVEEFLYDDLPEDCCDIAGAPEFNQTVNAWIKEHYPKTYTGNGQRVTSQVLIALQHTAKEQS